MPIYEFLCKKNHGFELMQSLKNGAAGGSLPPFILESFLLHNADNDMWRIVTVWESQDALEGYRASVETPEGVRMFRAAGAEPALTVFDVKAHVDHS